MPLLPANIRSRSINEALEKIARGFVVLCLFGTICFCVFYLLSGYDTLKHWYLSLNDCFLKSGIWATTFFTPAVKSSGDHFAIVAIIVSIICLFLIWKNGFKIAPPREQRKQNMWRWYMAVAGLTFGLGIWEWQMIMPTYDEVLSANYVSTLPFFQLWTYYLSTNNHIFFNLTNKLLFGWYTDPLQSGRLLSLLAYTGSMLYIFRWIVQLVNNRLRAFLVLLPVALQFSTLGFGILARGYEGQLLSGWVCVISLFDYLKSGDNRALQVNVIFNVLGFVIMPSYIYFFLSQLLFVLAVMVYDRRRLLKFWKFQFVLVSAVFPFYLPALCFSGLDTFINNKSVQPFTADVASFLPNLMGTMRYFINYCFSYIFGFGNVANYILFFLPILLLISKQRQNKLVGLFFVTLWIEFLLWSLKMRYIPYDRTMILHFSFTMASVAYTLYVLADRLHKHFKNSLIGYVSRLLLFSIPLLLLSIHLFTYSQKNATFQLYGYNSTGTYYRCIEQMRIIPVGSSIAFSEHSFYLCYVYRKFNYNVTQCQHGHEDYYVVRADEGETLPEEKKTEYILFSKDIAEHEVYKRK